MSSMNIRIAYKEHESGEDHKGCREQKGRKRLSEGAESDKSDESNYRMVRIIRVVVVLILILDLSLRSRFLSAFVFRFSSFVFLSSSFVPLSLFFVFLIIIWPLCHHETLFPPLISRSCLTFVII